MDCIDQGIATQVKVSILRIFYGNYFKPYDKGFYIAGVQSSLFTRLEKTCLLI
jgi:hypothetical protein